MNRARSMAGMLAALALPVAGLAPMAAHASVQACRSDPLVVLSNGVVLDLSAAVDTPSSDLKEVHYTLHGPKGVWVVRAISTDGPVQYDEHFEFHGDVHGDDHAASSLVPYMVEVKVHTYSGHHTVWATLAGGYASQVGITPDMVGLSAFQFNASSPQGDKSKDAPKPPKDDENQAQLPATVTAALASWAASAQWAGSTSSTAPEDHNQTASLSL